jgi:hydrogenase expression/formation protein HypD
VSADDSRPSGVIDAIRRAADGLGRITLMEVCGTHTMAIQRAGIRGLLPDNIRLVSGPGCPVCVTPNAVIDEAVALARLPDVTVLTFGDMVRVPGSTSSLEQERRSGADVRVVISPLDALTFSADHRDRRAVFIGVGFETTTPGVAATIKEARRRDLDRFFVLCAHKVMPPPMRALAGDPGMRIDGFLCPGHVGVVTGIAPFTFLADEHGKACVVSGFEPEDVLLSVLMLVDQIREERPAVEIQYRRAVRPGGNPRARAVVDEVFAPVDSRWRGLGDLSGSGLEIRDPFAVHDARTRISFDVEPTVEHAGCRCGEVLQGRIAPSACPLFGTDCSPETPVGACMVSTEGACAASYRHRED